jgi:hypothetical protein
VEYPIRSGRGMIDCPEHGCVVIVRDDGRIGTSCPLCLREAQLARRRFARWRRRSKPRVVIVQATPEPDDGEPTP